MRDIKPTVVGLENCPLHHREYVVSGRIRYEVVDTGEVVDAGAGSYLTIQPGHLASVVGDERSCSSTSTSTGPRSEPLALVEAVTSRFGATAR